MSFKKYIEKWLWLASFAPSGGNAQPWAVRLNDSLSMELSIDKHYAKNPSSMDRYGQAAMLSLGCFAESLAIASAGDGYKISSIEFENTEDFWNAKVILKWEKNDIEPVFTTQDLLRRFTARGEFSDSLASADLSIDDVNMVRLLGRWVESKEQVNISVFSGYRKDIILSLKSIEKLRWQNSKLFDSLLMEIDFSKRESYGLSNVGIHIDQLGISRFDQEIMKWMKNFYQLRYLMKTPLACISINKNFTNPIKNSAGVGFLFARDNTVKDWFDLGRVYQRVWLDINRHGILFQPLSHPLIVTLAKTQHDRSEVVDTIFSKKEISEISNVNTNFMKNYSLNFELPALGFRYGLPLEQNAFEIRPLSFRKDIHA